MKNAAIISNSVLAAICGAASGLASGQTPQSPGALALDEIVVTSRRVEERLQDVPVSITALTSTDLARQAIRSVADLVNATPNLTYSSSVTGRTAVPVIRGIALIDERGFDNAVGVFIDGIFVSGRAAQNVGMLDLERVEVIKGPQSALYGRNTFSGAINYVTRPTPDEFTARLEATLGSDSLTRVNGSIGGPVTEWFGARLAASYEDDKGTYRNTGPLGIGTGIGGIESKSALLSLRFTPADNLSIELGGYYSEEFADNLPLNPLRNNCGQFSRALNPSATSSDLANPLYFCGEGTPNGSGFLSMSPEAFSFDGETRRGTVSIAWELPGVTIQSLSAYTTTKNFGAQDLDRTQTGDTGYGFLPLSVYRAFGSPSFICSGFIPVGPCAAPNGGTAPLFNQIRSGTFNTYFSIANLDTDYVSSELRFTGPRDQRLRWLGGLFYFRSKNDDTTAVGVDARSAATALGLPTSQIQFLILDRGSIIPGLAPNGIAVRSPVYPPNVAFRTDTDLTTLTWSPLIDRQKAVFGSLEFDFTDTLTATAELRYTKESQQLTNAFDIFFFASGSASTESTFTDPRLTLRWKPSDELMVYASAARGTRSGGLNASVTDPALASFDEETNNTYEIGVKATFADGRLQLNAAAFKIDWKDAQFRQTVPSSTPGSVLTATTNAGDLESTGLELQAAARLSDAWTLEANLGFSNPEFGSNTFAAGEAALCRTLPAASSPYPVINVNCVARDIDGNGTIDVTQPEISGKQLRRTSKVTANLALEYARPVFGDSRLVARVDGNYRSKQYQDFSNLQYVPSRMLANLRVGIERENYDVILWVENLTDEDALAQTATVFSQSFNSLSSVTSGVNIPQRRYGVTARYRF